MEKNLKQNIENSNQRKKETKTFQNSEEGNQKMKCKISPTELIELGLNILAQDLIFKEHTKKDINNFINQFKFVPIKK